MSQSTRHAERHLHVGTASVSSTNSASLSASLGCTPHPPTHPQHRDDTHTHCLCTHDGLYEYIASLILRVLDQGLCGETTRYFHFLPFLETPASGIPEAYVDQDSPIEIPPRA